MDKTAKWGWLHNLYSSPNIIRSIESRYKTTALTAVLYGCASWSLTLREVHRLSVFVNRVLRRIFGPKMDEVGD